MNAAEKVAARHIANIMRTARKKKNLSQVEIAKALGISQSAVSKLEAGLLIPSVVDWIRFCQLTEMPLESLLDDEDLMKVIRSVSQGTPSPASVAS